MCVVFFCFFFVFCFVYLLLEPNKNFIGISTLCKFDLKGHGIRFFSNTQLLEGESEVLYSCSMS